MKFVVGAVAAEYEVGDFLLTLHSWNDYSYETRFTLTYLDNPPQVIGIVKILVRETEAGEPELATSTLLGKAFSHLDPKRGCSVGQSNSYYERLALLPNELWKAVARALNDVAFSEEEPWWEGTFAWKNSLLRENTAILAWVEARGIVRGEKKPGTTRKLIPYSRSLGGVHGGPEMLELKFDGSLPVPGRLNVLVGKNGTGKTSVLAGMKNWFSRTQSRERWTFTPEFLKVLVVSFNPFDNLYATDSPIFGQSNVRYFGLPQIDKKLEELLSMPQAESNQGWMEALLAVFPDAQALREKLPQQRVHAEATGLLTSLQHDSAWMNFVTTVVEPEASDLSPQAPSAQYQRMSAGYRVLMQIHAFLYTELDANVLVTIDEPENHLHPSLVARFIRQLNVLLEQKQSFGIVATHSPVIVQETPSQFVWVLTREGYMTTARHPEFETFGASIDSITERLFETDFTSSHWKAVLRNLAEKGMELEEAERQIGSKNLSPLARSYLAFQIAKRRKE